MSKRWLPGLVALTILIASCSLADPAGSLAPGESAAPEDSACARINIVGPSGARVDLTGVWRSNDLGVYDIYQTGSCLYWMGMSHFPGFEAGEIWTNVFVGTVNSDFTIVGRWGDVPFIASRDVLGHGDLSLRIDFDQSADEELPVLRATGGTGFFGGTAWVREESLSPPTDLVGSFGGTVTGAIACPWIEANGERYELIGSGVWRIRNVPLSVQDDSGHIVARDGDPIRVSGQLSGPLGSGCTETAIVVEDLDPAP